jgi:hypothetical protein
MMPRLAVLRQPAELVALLAHGVPGPALAGLCRLTGTGLDVLDPEPLPADPPLWALDNVIISPHRSGQRPHSAARFPEILLRNLACFLQGAPLHNLADRQRCC